MLELEPYQVRCRSCFSIFSYLNGFCPVCGGTGFVSLERSILQPEGKSASEEKKPVDH